MEKKIIKLAERDTTIIELADSEGNLTGETLEIDLEDIELPLRLQKSSEMHKNNVRWLENQFKIIDKKQDHKGKKLYSANEEAKIIAQRDFFLKEMEAIDLVIGKDGCKKMINGRKPYLTMFADINDKLEPVIGHLKVDSKRIMDKVKSKYAVKEDDVIE